MTDAQEWNDAAASFDEQPDHGLRDPRTRAAWAKLLEAWLPSRRSGILDIGCGTGSLSLVLADLGHAVVGIDVSPAMLAHANKKTTAAGRPVPFGLMDAAQIGFKPASFDVLVCRHLLWALSNPADVLQSWAGLLRPGGRFLLIEGYWGIGSGLHARELAGALPAAMALVTIKDLSNNAEYWGRAVSDERYLLVAEHHESHSAA